MTTTTSTASQLSLRDRKKQRTRDALVRVAQELFDRQGYDATTIDQIADAAEVSRRTFFRYFPTKEAIVFPRHRDRLDAFTALIGNGEGAPFDLVRQALLTMSDDYMRHRADALRQHRLVQTSRALMGHELEHDRRWQALIAQALGDDGSRTEPAGRARLRAGAIMGLIRATLDEWFAGDAKGDLRAMGQSAIRLLEPDDASR